VEPALVTSPDGTSIAVWRSGHGEPLVLVHGTSADHGRWAPVLPALEERFTVLSMDRRGRGGSGDAGRYAIEREFEDVAAVIDAAGEQVDVIGHSYGALCTLEAALHTSAIRRLVLYEPPLGFVQSPQEVVDRLHARLEAGDREGVVAMFLQEVAGLPPDQVELMRSLPAWRGRVETAGTIPREEAAEREYTWEPDRFRDVRVPTLFLLGGDSPEPFRLAAEAVAESLPHCRIVVMPGQRHAAIDTGTELFTREVLAFLAAE
jgi:pimeloyl-ACP methyl ester carboxylesterase